MVSGAKKQEKFNKDFEEGNLILKEFKRLPNDKKDEYIKRELKKKYNLDKVTFECMECAKVALFEDDGYITDDDLIQATNLRRK